MTQEEFLLGWLSIGVLALIIVEVIVVTTDNDDAMFNLEDLGNLILVVAVWPVFSWVVFIPLEDHLLAREWE